MGYLVEDTGSKTHKDIHIGILLKVKQSFFQHTNIKQLMSSVACSTKAMEI
jgi:hypothetical protein